MSTPVPLAYTCCCGERHAWVDPVLHAIIGHVLMSRGERVVVEYRGRAWLAPRVFIAWHGIKADKLPDLAAKYEWERVVK